MTYNLETLRGTGYVIVKIFVSISPIIVTQCLEVKINLEWTERQNDTCIRSNWQTLQMGNV